MQSFVFWSTGVTAVALQAAGAAAVGGSGAGRAGEVVAAGTASAAGGDLRTAVVAALAAVLVFLILYPLARALTRGKEKGVSSSADTALTSRLERLERSVEAMKVDIERISEGQRYTTKLLTERLPLAARVPQSGQTDKTLL